MEGQVCAEKGYTGLQENRWPQADECNCPEEIIGHDEGKVGGEEERLVETP